MREEKAPNSVAEGCQFPNHIAEWKNKEYGNEICPVVKLQYSKMQKVGDKGRCRDMVEYSYNNYKSTEKKGLTRKQISLNVSRA